ncbi:MAG: hypothetical protein KJ645_06395 [Planctomycetes bacterium]|nr:hypothetical protein [Planctomycetota bacterium]
MNYLIDPYATEYDELMERLGPDWHGEPRFYGPFKGYEPTNPPGGGGPGWPLYGLKINSTNVMPVD